MFVAYDVFQGVQFYLQKIIYLKLLNILKKHIKGVKMTNVFYKKDSRKKKILTIVHLNKFQRVLCKEPTYSLISFLMIKI